MSGDRVAELDTEGDSDTGADRLIDEDTETEPETLGLTDDDVVTDAHDDTRSDGDSRDVDDELLVSDTLAFDVKDKSGDRVVEVVTEGDGDTGADRLTVDDTVTDDDTLGLDDAEEVTDAHDDTRSDGDSRDDGEGLLVSDTLAFIVRDTIGDRVTEVVTEGDGDTSGDRLTDEDTVTEDDALGINDDDVVTDAHDDSRSDGD